LIFKNVEVYGDEDLNRALDWLERREGSIAIDNFLLGYVERETGALERIIRICPDLQVFAIYVDSEEPFDLSIVSNLRRQSRPELPRKGTSTILTSRLSPQSFTLCPYGRARRSPSVQHLSWL
jgi:hypothetical protein